MLFFGVFVVFCGFIIMVDDVVFVRRRDGDAIFYDVLSVICEFIEYGDDVYYRFYVVMCLKVVLEKMKLVVLMGVLKMFLRDVFDRIAFVIASRWEDIFGYIV